MLGLVSQRHGGVVGYLTYILDGVDRDLKFISSQNYLPFIHTCNVFFSQCKSIHNTPAVRLKVLRALCTYACEQFGFFLQNA